MSPYPLMKGMTGGACRDSYSYMTPKLREIYAVGLCWSELMPKRRGEKGEDPLSAIDEML